MLGGKTRTPQTPPGETAPGIPTTAVDEAAVTPGQTGSRPAAFLPESPEKMLGRAVAGMAEGKDPQRLLNVAIAHRDHWGRLEEQRAAAPERFDGRASIYTGETYAQARDRFEAYRVLLVEETRGTHGGC